MSNGTERRMPKCRKMSNGTKRRTDKISNGTKCHIVYNVEYMWVMCHFFKCLKLKGVVDKN